MPEKENPLPTRDDCYELFERYGTPAKVIHHCETVNKVAIFLGTRFKEAGIPVNVKLVDRASLLHDIARVSDHHAQRGAEIMRQRGYPQIATIISHHRYDTIGQNDLETWEEKIVYYADKRAVYEIIPLEERVKRWMKKYPKYKKSIKEKLSLVRGLEQELFGYLSITPNELKEKVNSFVEDRREDLKGKETRGR